MRCHEVQLSEIPDDKVTAEHFMVAEVDVAECGDGQVLVGLRRLGLNAGLAHRLGGEGTAYGPGIGIGDVPSSDAVVEVLESRHGDFAVGDLAVGKMQWRTAAVIDGSELTTIGADLSEEELNARLTVLGHVGFTAWTGIMHVGQVQPDDVVYVSGAAGGVGSCVVQFAKAVGATVIGVAGSAEKVKLLTETMGADRAINRHDGDATELLRDAAPDGISLYYDNVGGAQLEAALDVLSDGGAIVMCGAVAGSEPPRNLRNFIHKELTMQGFTVTEHEDLRGEFEEQVSGWMDEGKVQSIHTVFEGIDQVPAAFASLLEGSSTGRVIVAVESQLPGHSDPGRLR
ncbi:MAG: NADP-dependent oxidoreductase [Propionibacteriaceae bacterium]|nr:NADP-dependent oxidoreductase [Propionibacteriaceae bacterium]